MDPNWLTGFVDGEGSFIISIQKNLNYRTGWSVHISFSISLHKKDQPILELLKAYFGGIGKIYKQGKDSIQYQVFSQQDLTNIIIPHFDKYPLITQKRADF